MQKLDKRWRPQADSIQQPSIIKKEYFAMKKVISLIVSVMMIVSLFAGCGAGEEPGVKTDFKVAIVQQLDHSSLDEIREAITAQLNALAEPTNFTVTIEEYNGQNDASVLNQIGTEVVSEGFDMIIPIATTAAQIMVTAAEGNIPVVYAAVSDPEGNGLTGMDNVTGTSDALNTPFILDMMFAADPDIQTVGLLYSNSEPNSEKPIAEAKEYLDAKGIAYIEKTGNTSGEIIEAASALVGRVDAVFTPTDNAVMAAEAAVAEILNEAGIPHYAGADSFVISGAFATCGVNYTELGTYTAQMAMDILLGGEVPEFHVMDGGIITANSMSGHACGLNISVFLEMASTVIDVCTGTLGM